MSSFYLIFLTILIMVAAILKFTYFKKHKQVDEINRKAILITGCDSGVGLEMAKYIYDLGFIVFAGFLSNQSKGFREINLIKERDKSLRLILVSLDVTNQQLIDETKQIIENFLNEQKIKGLWGLINNAGICVFGEFDWYSWDHIESQVQINLLGLLRVTRTFLKYIIESKGRIINVSSVNGIHSYPGISVYSATKFALRGFSDSLRFELDKFGVNVITFTLGDFAKLTNLFKSYDNMKEMWSTMDDCKRKFYYGYFNKYHNLAKKNFGYTSPKSFQDTSFFTDLKEVTTSKSPPDFVLVANFSTRLFFLIFSILNSYYRKKFLTFINKTIFGLNEYDYFKTDCSQMIMKKSN